ncbi:vesicle-associated membrane protein 2 [Fukomys damarensis]|uniref:vesicle-associated membrane protein 2 n=1 Tax=Fukomys damarensis TaxID=885580 RepID=UPI00053FEE87|nr:vesicle-associated membrane protein 2 [Fukomys damarensis]
MAASRDGRNCSESAQEQGPQLSTLLKNLHESLSFPNPSPFQVLKEGYQMSKPRIRTLDHVCEVALIWHSGRLKPRGGRGPLSRSRSASAAGLEGDRGSHRVPFPKRTEGRKDGQVDGRSPRPQGRRLQAQDLSQFLVLRSATAATAPPSAPAGEGGPPAPPPNLTSNRRLQQTQAQVDEVVDIMRVNVDKVLERDQKLSELDDRADALQAGASQFETSAAKLKRKYWWKNLKMMIILGVICAIILIIIIVYFST